MKPFILLYSHSGNTRRVGQTLAQLTGGDFAEIVPIHPYPTDYNAVVDQAKGEIRKGFLPELQPVSADLAAYDTIFIGTPNWWSTMAPPVASFLHQSDLAGKRLAPFCTHGGGGLARVARDIKGACPQCEMAEPFEIYGDGGAALEQKLLAWLRNLGIDL